MPTVAEAFAVAVQSHQAGNQRQAELLCRQILQVDAGHADAWCLLGAARQAQGLLAEAESCLRRTVELAPNHPSARNYLGTVLAQQGRLDEAAACFEALVRAQPQDAEGHNNLALVRAQQQRLSEAVAHFRHAIKLQPAWADAHYNLGNALYLLGDVDDAIAHYHKALKSNPTHAEAHSNLADALRNQGKVKEAIAHFHQALAIRADLPEAHANLALAHQVEGDVEQAVVHFQEARRLKPDNRVRTQLALLLPPIYQSLGDLQSWRQRLTDQVRQLHAESFKLDLTNETALPPFYLAYQGCNDRDLQRQIASLYSAPALAVRPSRHAKINLAFVSSFFTDHTVGHWMRGLVAQLPRQSFTVTVYSFGRHQGEVADFFRQHADHYVTLPNHMPSARRIIAESQLDVLFYTDIGMEPLTYTLAFTRLAPVQCVTVGHPVTTGIGTIDYFISSEQLEDEGGQEHYTETLVQLPALPTYYHRPQLQGPAKERGYFGLSKDDHIYICPQSLFKFHPEFDELLGGILRGDPRGRLVLCHGQARQGVDMLRQRFARSIADVADRIQFVPMLNHNEFLNLLAVSDVQLDTLHFGGGRTSYDGFAMGTPIVTWPSKFLRGRITLSLYKQMGLLDCVAKSADDYVNIALKLGTDNDYGQAVRRQILAAGDALYDNMRGFLELERFLQEAVAAAKLN